MDVILLKHCPENNWYSVHFLWPSHECVCVCVFFGRREEQFDLLTHTFGISHYHSQWVIMIRLLIICISDL